MIPVSKEDLCTLLGVLPGNALVEDIWERMKLAGWQVFKKQEVVGENFSVVRTVSPFPWWVDGIAIFGKLKTQ
jgi:hypothetical protein